MSLKEVYTSFGETPDMPTNSGKSILEKRILPLLSNSTEYFRTSSYFNPVTIIDTFDEFAKCLRNKGSIKIIIGIHDSSKLLPIFEIIDGDTKEDKFKNAVSKLLEDDISACAKLLEDFENFNYVLAELVKQEYIQVKIATVTEAYESYISTGLWPENAGIFHSKSTIFKNNDEMVLMNGSINQTKKGYGDNTEDAVFKNSWNDKPSVEQHLKIFNQLWENQDEKNHVCDFNTEMTKIATKVISQDFRFKFEQKKRTFSYSHFSNLLSNSPLFHHVSFNRVNLLPHQIAIYQNALSRWPIKCIIADEVGLGKTIEGGSIISYLLQYGDVENVALVVPALLKSQWQNELKQLFELDFFVYNNSKKQLECFDRKIKNVGVEQSLKKGKRVIYSSHYLRNISSDFLNNSNVDLILVDEAHQARGENDDNRTETKLFSFLENALSNVTHKILLTATPLQTEISDYTSLLQLVSGKKPTKEEISTIIKINNKEELTDSERHNAFQYLKKQNIEPYATSSKSIWEQIADLDIDDYVNNHITTRYTLRNTRSELEKIGYEFPISLLKSISVHCHEDQKRFLSSVNSYIEGKLYKLESSISSSSSSRGFIKSTYNQRIVSSFKAAIDTITKRKKTLNDYLEQGYVLRTYFNGEGEAIPLAESKKIDLTTNLTNYINEEIEFIDSVFSHFEYLKSQDLDRDPKITEAYNIIKSHLEKDHKVLVFSRFVSTTQSLKNYVLTNTEQKISVGIFEGGTKEIHKSDGSILPTDKEDLVERFKKSEFDLLICSDAASEGINLQCANVLINIDVPWNPTRLLQRFGRIDRFGQKNKELHFYNVYYPDSVEDKQYKRLIERNNLFREILGVTPDITDKEHIDGFFTYEDPTSINTHSKYLNSLLNLKKADNVRAHELLLELIKNNTHANIEEGNITFIDKEFSYSNDFMDADYLNYKHNILSVIHSSKSGTQLPLHALYVSSHLFCYLIEEEENFYVLHDKKELIRYLICDDSIDIKNKKAYGSRDLLSSILNDFELIVNHNKNILNEYPSSLYAEHEIRDLNCYIYCKK